jgi:hypothetical protein
MYAGTPLNNTTYHLAAVRSGSSYQKIYVNGAELSTMTPAYGGFDSSLTLGALGRLSQSVSSRYLNGEMYQVRMYNRALSSAEIAQNYNSIKGKFGI